MSHGKNSVLTPWEMETENQKQLESNPLYKPERAEAISQLVRSVAADATKDRERINLRDTGRVREISEDYITACTQTPIIPSKSGLARALGYSRSGVWCFMRDNPEHPTSLYLDVLFDAFSECYDIAAMTGQIPAIFAIFIQKAQYGLRDNAPLDIPTAADPLGNQKTTAEIMEKYMDLIEED